MDASYIGLIIIGILTTIIAILGVFFGVAMIFVAPTFGKLIGIFLIAAMAIFVVGLWALILN